MASCFLLVRIDTRDGSCRPGRRRSPGRGASAPPSRPPGSARRAQSQTRGWSCLAQSTTGRCRPGPGIGAGCRRR